ncbi:MAG: acetoacetate--CoA ligase [Gammaproteobacteria bacterium]|nr:acetoacetate--CoA ligase [Gammaproteobacteria bacterium]
MTIEGELLWTPDADWVERANITDFMRWLKREQGREFRDYPELYEWSVNHLEEFWEAVWKYFGIQSSTPYECVLASKQMPGAHWFPGARLNYAQHALQHEHLAGDAVIGLSELRPAQHISWHRFAADVRIVATQLRGLGIGPGDRVVAYLPNIPEAVVALLAVTSIGAIWSSCSPDFGIRSVLDRFTQIAPKALFCVDGYRYRGKDFNRKQELAEVIARLPTLERVIFLPYLDPSDRALPSANARFWSDLMDHPAVHAEDFRYEHLPFEHPLWILFSSGTTGLPKAIVHSHGGITLEQSKLITFHMDMKPGERLFFFTTTGWMMWNFLASSLLVGATPILYDGNPAHPEPDALWKIAAEHRATVFGASPTYVQMLEQADVVPRDKHDLSALREIVLAGSPVTAECNDWFYKNVKRDLWVAAGSGGTDVCTGFCGGIPTQPVYAGEIQARHLGVDAQSFDAQGRPVIDEVGELVIRQPMPSMPVYFWNDEGGRRYRESYFEEFPGVWRHGDFFKLNARGGCFVLGRSDATLNRYGVRIGTAEIYRCVQALPEVADALIVNLDLPGGKFFMPMFVQMAEGRVLDEAVRDRIRRQLRTDYSPRHVPDQIYEIKAVPYTLTGKKMEIPVRRILMGQPVEKVANRDAMADPAALDYFVRFAREWRDYSPG